MGKRQQRREAALAAWHQRQRELAEYERWCVCYRCEEAVLLLDSAGAGTGTDLAWCVTIWLCTACCAALEQASRPPKRSTGAWETLPECSRCQAQVPGSVALPPMDLRDEHFAVWLCHQCALTLHRQCLKEAAEMHEEPVAYDPE